MCGIFGHVGEEGSIDKCMSGLRYLEYRGYDSVGVAGVEGGSLVAIKEKGPLASLEKILGNQLAGARATIGHTRWATHGKATQLNAHPHLDESGRVAVVHNGIIENYLFLRGMLEAEGKIFKTETDTEVIAQLIDHYYKGDLLTAVQKAMSQCEGFWGVAILHKDHPDQIIATRNENPVVIGLSESGNAAYVSSDPQAISENSLELFYLNNRELARVTQDKIEIFDSSLSRVYRESESYDVPLFELDKEGYDHFMLKEIHEQPLAIRRAMEGRVDRDNEKVTLPLAEDFLSGCSDILILGCGTSWHAGLIAAQQIEALSGIPSRAEIASEFRYRQSTTSAKTLVIALSQSGETFDTVAAVKKAKRDGAKVLAICNVPGSSLIREADAALLLNAGMEVSVCSTKAFISMLVVLTLISLTLSEDEVRSKSILQHLIALPSVVDAVLAQSDEISELAKKYSGHSHVFFLGRQYMYPSALESALKLKEISYLSSFGYAAGELKHGPIALIDSTYLVIGLCGHSQTYDKLLSNLTEVKSREGAVLAIAPHGSLDLEELTNDVLYLPLTCDELAPIPYNVATQLFAYYVAKDRKAEIDRPRNLAKSVTVE